MYKLKAHERQIMRIQNTIPSNSLQRTHLFPKTGANDLADLSTVKIGAQVGNVIQRKID